MGNKVGTTVISQYDYSVNALGQRTAVATSGTAFPAMPSWAWGYDSLGQVITADSSVNTNDRAYQYDTIGNRIQGSAGVPPALETTTYLTNALNQYTSIQDPQSTIFNPSYDFDGNMISGPLPANPTENSALAWDAENRLIQAGPVSPSGPSSVTNLYDAQFRLISRSVGVAPTSTTIYLYDGFNCIAEYQLQNSSFIVHHSKLWGIDLSGSMQGAGGVGGLLSETIHDPQSTIYYPTYDGNGNVSEYLASDGSVSAHFEYDPFGNIVKESYAEGFNSTRFTYKFSTKPLDAVTGLYYYTYRYYDPQTGRWPSKDPIEEQGGHNLYGFTKNTPSAKIDHFGLIDDVSQSDYSSLQNNKSDCEKIMDHIKKNNEKIARLIDYYDTSAHKQVPARTRCPEPKIDCKCCQGTQLAGYRKATNTIEVCYNSINRPPYDKVDDIHGDLTYPAVLYHEFIHWAQGCGGSQGFRTDCDWSICKEIQAWAKSNCAHITDEFKRTQCVKNGVSSSSKAHCPGLDRAAIIERITPSVLEECQSLRRK